MMKDLTKSREQLELTGLSNKEKKQLGDEQIKIFEEAKKKAKENHTLH